MSCDAPDQTVFESLLKLADRHESADWQETGLGGNVLILPLTDLERDPEIDVNWHATRPTGPLRVRIAQDHQIARSYTGQPGWVLAVPEAEDAPKGAGRISFDGQCWTLIAIAPGIPDPDDLRSLKAPAPDEIEDLDAREKWFRDRH